jgi:hypothetical protein
MVVRYCGPYIACRVTVLQMCVTVNDLEYVRRSLSVLGAELHVETILEAVDAATGDAGRQQWRQALYAMLEGAINQLEARALQVINRVAAKVRHCLSAGYGLNLGCYNECSHYFPQIFYTHC